MELRVWMRLNVGQQTSNQISKFIAKASKNIEIEVSEGDRPACYG
jgi:hypothetical protein